MVKITFAPADELIVHEILKVEKDDLLRERITPQGTMPLCWCNGILFSFSSIPMTDDVTKEYLRGKIHWLEVHYTKVPTYTPIMTLNEEEYKGAMNIRILDTSISKLHQDFTKWLNTQK